ncbi:MAG: cytochrome c [Magnetococcales bacterium]|nr:hypothetical protein [Magnetococcales bacterium]NGZ28322.1 cytochrome c [Magnetococcales bacterium]
MQHSGTPSPADARTPVQLPGELKQHMLANMRDHMLALQEITTGLSQSEFDKVATIAEERLGVSSGKRHGAHQVAAYMPAGMSQIGGATHQAASRLALAAQDAGVTGDTKPVLAALAEVMIGCVACHGAYRLE